MPGDPLIAYSSRAIARPFYYANAHEKDRVDVQLVPMSVASARQLAASVDVEGFELLDHVSAVSDFSDHEQVAAVHVPEVIALLKQVTGADEVQVTPRGILRFSEKSGKQGSSDNSHPARFAHIDISSKTAAEFATRGAAGRKFRRCAAYNLWRALSPAPQDVPLALCDARSFSRDDLIVADAIFDPPGGAPEWSFESWVVAPGPGHRWFYYPDLNRDEVILFKTADSDPERAQCIPHVAFDDPSAPDHAPPRISIEMRATCYWWE